LKRYAALIFDLDDTLYLEREYVWSGFRAVAAWAAEHLGLPQDRGFERLCMLFEQGVRRDTFNQWLGLWGVFDETLVPQLVSVYREHWPDIAPFSIAPALLEHFHRFCRLGLVSDGYLNVQERKLEALNLRPFFDVVVFPDREGRDAWKPNPKPFYEALEQLGNIAPTESLYIADNPTKDFLAPRRLGMGSIRIRHPEGLYYSVEPPTPEYMPDVVVQFLEDLPQVIACLAA